MGTAVVPQLRGVNRHTDHPSRARIRSSPHQNNPLGESPTERVTVSFRFTRVLNKNLKAYSVKQDRTQNEVVEEAVRRFLREHGVKVDQPPTITWDSV